MTPRPDLVAQHCARDASGNAVHCHKCAVLVGRFMRGNSVFILASGSVAFMQLGGTRIEVFCPECGAVRIVKAQRLVRMAMVG